MNYSNGGFGNTKQQDQDSSDFWSSFSSGWSSFTDSASNFASSASERAQKLGNQFQDNVWKPTKEKVRRKFKSIIVFIVGQCFLAFMVSAFLSLRYPFSSHEAPCSLCTCVWLEHPLPPSLALSQTTQFGQKVKETASGVKTKAEEGTLWTDMSTSAQAFGTKACVHSFVCACVSLCVCVCVCACLCKDYSILAYNHKPAHFVHSQIKTSGEKGWTNFSNYFKQLTTADDEEEGDEEGEEGESGSQDRKDSWREEGWGDDWGDMQGYGRHEKQPANITEEEQNSDWRTGDSSWNSEEQSGGSDKKAASSPAVIAVGDETGRLLMEDSDLIDWSEGDGWGSWGTTPPNTTKRKAGKASKAD